MSAEPSLFGDDDSPEVDAPEAPAAIATWQVGLLRRNLDALGLADMVERQRAIEAAVGRPVESLRALTHVEAMRAVERLGQTAPARSSGNAWDERDENTWIDRL